MKFDGIYLCPAPNFQGGHKIMDLHMGQFITRPKVVQITIIDVVINDVENVGEAGI